MPSFLALVLGRGGMQLRKASEPEVPPGYDPALAEKPKTKSAKRNERKKEKRHQVVYYFPPSSLFLWPIIRHLKKI